MPASIAVGLAGLVVGSFLNVCIVRIPERRSIWGPGSSCPSCGAPIAWRDNVPLLSYVVLRGRCRTCKSLISPRYPLVEAITAAGYVLAYLRFGWSAGLPVTLLLISALVVATAIDLAHQIIPDLVTLPGILVGFLANLVTGRIHWVDSLVGILAGSGIFLAVILASRGGMGGGDMKLGAMLGAFLGWKVALIGFLIAALAGGAFAVVLLATKIRGRKDPVPFGPFLALGGAVAVFWGERLLTWYLASFQT